MREVRPDQPPTVTGKRSIENQTWCVHVGEYMVFGSIVGSDYNLYHKPTRINSRKFTFARTTSCKNNYNKQRLQLQAGSTGNTREAFDL